MNDNGKNENEEDSSQRPVVYRYTRAQALEDGFLVDLSQLAREAGFKFPVAVTDGVWKIINAPGPLEAVGQSWRGRAWDMLFVLRLEIRRGGNSDEVHFAPLFKRERGGPAVPVKMWSKCGPGDTPAPVITIMLEGED